MDRLLQRVDDKFGAFGVMLVMSMIVLVLTIVLSMVVFFAPYLLLILPAIAGWMVWSVWRE